MDEYITQEELEKLLETLPGQRNKGSNWKERIENITAGKPLVLYPADRRHCHILDVTARAYAKQYDVKIKTRTWNDNGQLKLFIFRA